MPGGHVSSLYSSNVTKALLKGIWVHLSRSIYKEFNSLLYKPIYPYLLNCVLLAFISVDQLEPDGSQGHKSTEVESQGCCERHLSAGHRCELVNIILFSGLKHSIILLVTEIA